MKRIMGSPMDDFKERIKFNTDRDAYNYISSKIGDPLYGLSKNTLPTEGYLRLEVDLTTQNEVKFKMLENDGNMTVNEKRLAISEMFLATKMIFGFYCSDDGAAPRRSISVLQTFYNPLFPGITSSVNTQALYNGSFEIRVNDTVYFDRYDAMRFYRVGVAQAGLAASANATDNIYSANEWTGIDYARAPLTPFILFGGKSSNKVNLELPESVDFTDADQMTAVVIFQGILLQNAYD